MTTEKRNTIGHAIDLIIEAIEPFDDASQQTILTAVCSHLKIARPGATTSTLNPGAGAPIDLQPREAVRKFDGSIDIKTLKNQKQPTSAQQMACLVAYYLTELVPEQERQSTVTVADLEKYFKQAGFPLSKKMEQLLIDGKRAGYFDSAARGEYSLTRVGHNLVAHQMPRKLAE